MKLLVLFSYFLLLIQVHVCNSDKQPVNHLEQITDDVISTRSIVLYNQFNNQLFFKNQFNRLQVETQLAFKSNNSFSFYLLVLSVQNNFRNFRSILMFRKLKM